MSKVEVYTNSIKIAFEGFDKFENGKPIMMIPTGVWYRGERILTITENILVAVVGNFNNGLPRYRVAITLDHNDYDGKVGEVHAIEYLPGGPQGSGLYATEYEFYDRGLEAIEEKGYDAVSAEMVWSLNYESTYQDPETGAEYDNVLVGLTLTPHPFFGHDHVALYSAKPQQEVTGMDNETLFSKLVETLKDLLGANEPDEIIEPVEQEVDEMADELEGKEVLTQEIDTDAFVSREEYESLSEQHTVASEKIEKLEGELGAEKLARQKEMLGAEADAFKALSVDKDAYIEKMSELRDLSEELADWVLVMLQGADTAMVEADVFAEIGTSLEGDGEFDLEAEVQKVIEEKFDGDQDHYAEALAIVGKAHPDKVQV